MKVVPALALVSALLVSGGVLAKNVAGIYPLQPVLFELSKTAGEGAVPLYFGKQPTPDIAERLKVETVTLSGTHRDHQQEVCEKIAVRLLTDLRQRARELGADAVVNIRSTYNGGGLSSETDFECRLGNVKVAIELSGELVKFKKN